MLGTDCHAKDHNRSIGFHNPRYAFGKDEIAIVHVPKTGGTSLHHVLKNCENLKVANLLSHRPVSQLCDPRHYEYITILREPVERVWSYYQMVLGSEADFPYKAFAKNLRTFLGRCWEVRNMACRYYSGSVDAEPNATTLGRAMENLKNFSAVIQFDNFERDVRQVLARRNLSVEAVPHMRKSHYVEMTDEERRMILEYNEFDGVLFRAWARLLSDGAGPA